MYLVSAPDANAAYKVGVAAQQHGSVNDFYPAHDTFLETLGYRYHSNAPCACPDVDDFGHLPTCGWVLMQHTQTAADAEWMHDVHFGK